MIVVDTNVWARAFLGDHPDQTPRARQALAAARSKEGVFLPLLVLTELSWVLRAGRWDRQRTLKTLESLLHTRGVTPEAPELAQAAIDAARDGQGGFADHLIAEVGLANGCQGVLTFDALFGKGKRVRRLP